MGAVIAPRVDPMLVMEFMEYGSLYDLLRNETMYAGGEILLQIIKDITQGINFLHSSRPPILHGDLKAKNILVDCRFRVSQPINHRSSVCACFVYSETLILFCSHIY
jgi:guanylate cyclase, other